MNLSGANAGFLLAASVAIQPAPAQEAGVPSAEKPEEVVVYGRTKARLRHELYHAEERVFSVFNALNSDDEYDIHCGSRATTGSLIKQRACEANFVGKATSEEAKAFLMGRPGIPAFVVIRRKNRTLILEMKTLARERPELFDALVDLADARDRIESLHAKRRAGD